MLRITITATILFSILLLGKFITINATVSLGSMHYNVRITRIVVVGDKLYFTSCVLWRCCTTTTTIMEWWRKITSSWLCIIHVFITMCVTITIIIIIIIITAHVILLLIQLLLILLSVVISITAHVGLFAFVPTWLRSWLVWFAMMSRCRICNVVCSSLMLRCNLLHPITHQT